MNHCARLFGLAICLVGLLEQMTQAAAGDPEPGARKEIRFVGEGQEEVTIAFRWCPAGLMKDGDPANSEDGLPNSDVEGFWLSESEISQRDFRTIVGNSAMDSLKNEVLDAKFPSNVEAIQQAIQQARDEEAELFANDAFPLYGIQPDEADDFCRSLSAAYDRFQDSRGLHRGYATYQFRLPLHFEWQYARRGVTGRRHFAEWPDNAKEIDIGGIGDYGAFLKKKSPKLYEEHKDLLDSFHGTEDEIVAILSNDTLPKDVRALFEEILWTIVGVFPKTDAKRRSAVSEGRETSWGLKGMAGNASEWVRFDPAISFDRLVDRSSQQPFSDARAVQDIPAGDWTVSSHKNYPPWDRLSIWHWQDSAGTAAASKGKKWGKLKRVDVGLRVLMTDAVSETWFADLRNSAQEAFAVQSKGVSLKAKYESGIEVSSRDKEGPKLAQARIGIYGAMARSRTGDRDGAVKLLRETVTQLRDSGDDFFSQLEAVIGDDDLRD